MRPGRWRTRGTWHSNARRSSRSDRTYRGVVYDSRMEMRRAIILDCALNDGQIRAWSRQRTFMLGGIVKYRVDFIVTMNDGTTRYEEVKGRVAKKRRRPGSPTRAGESKWRVSEPGWATKRRAWEMYGPGVLHVISCIREVWESIEIVTPRPMLPAVKGLFK